MILLIALAFTSQSLRILSPQNLRSLCLNDTQLGPLKSSNQKWRRTTVVLHQLSRKPPHTFSRSSLFGFEKTLGPLSDGQGRGWICVRHILLLIAALIVCPVALSLASPILAPKPKKTGVRYPAEVRKHTQEVP